VAEVTAMRVEEQPATERAISAKWGLEAAKAHQAETEVGLQKSLADTEAALQKSLETLESKQSALVSERNTLELARKALESERKARSEADREVLMLRGQVMGMEEASARLHEQVAWQAEEFSVLENFRIGKYLFFFSSCWFFPLACFRACRPSFRAGRKGEVAGAGPGDDQGDFWPKCRGAGQVL